MKVYDTILDGYQADEIAEDYKLGYSNEAAVLYFKNVIYDGEFVEENMPKYHRYVDTIDGEYDVYYDYGADYFFCVHKEQNMSVNEARFLRDSIRRILKESAMYEENNGKAYIEFGDDFSGDQSRYNAMLGQVMPLMQKSNEDSTGTYNMTRSQIAYKLWPDLDKDTARSKLSQKINAEKAFTVEEVMKIYQMFHSFV